MLNQSVVVGRLVRDPELYETENGNKVTSITLAVPRSYKNTEGEYDTDFIQCTLCQNNMGVHAFAYGCHCYDDKGEQINPGLY